MDTGIPSPLTPQRDAPAPHPRWLNTLALVIGLTAMALGPLAGRLFIFLSLTSRQETDPLAVTTIGISMIALGLGVGGVLAWTGYEGSQRRPSRAFRPGTRWFWGCLIGLGLALPAGQLLISFDLRAPLTFPPFHVLGVTLPAIAMLAVIGRGVRIGTPTATQRQVIGQLALGAFGATAIAFTLEAVMVAAGLVLVGAMIALSPGGLAQLVELQRMLADPALLQNPQTLARWLLKPPILLSVTVMLTVIAPMIEEGAKSLGVPLLVLWTRGEPTPAQGWLWGIAAGAGFAIAEGLFNSAANLPFWAGIALLRVGATVMHITTAGLTGLGWTRTLASRRPWPLFGSYLASVTLHGLWNGMTMLMVISSLWAIARPGNPSGMVVGGLGVVIGLTGWVLLTAAIIGVARYVTLRVREQQACHPQE